MLRGTRRLVALSGIGWLLAGADVAGAHFLSAVTHGANDNTTDVNVDRVDAHGEIGNAGPASNYVVGDARVDSSTGRSEIAVTGAWGAGGTFITMMEASTQLREVLDVDDPGGSGRIQARLTIDASGQVENVPPDGARIVIEAELYLTEFCRIFFSQRFGFGGGEPVISQDCEELHGTATADGSTIIVDLHDLPNTVEVRAILSGEMNLGQLDSGNFAAEAALQVEALDGATYEPESSTFLTEVPEPGATSLAVASIGALGGVARRRCA